MTLTELLPTIQQLSTPEKIKLIQILSAEVDVYEDIAPLEPFKTYDLPTPYDSFGGWGNFDGSLKTATGC
jgi:hypothetical protein